MKCHKCFARISRKANYCPNCGRSVTGDEECIEKPIMIVIEKIIKDEK